MAAILLADDSDDLRAVIARCLRDRGHDVREATDGVEALESLKASHPDLLLLDIWMPRLNGYEVLDILRRDNVGIGVKVVMLSVLSDAESQFEALGIGAADYVVKGSSLQEIVAHVEGLLGVDRGVSDDTRPGS